ncbi:hypothetical protein [Rubritepida flocculans]|jgi:hypothetical protein|nr:hypothetical protein [Rubritepida flocculans]
MRLFAALRRWLRPAAAPQLLPGPEPVWAGVVRLRLSRARATHPDPQ